MTESGADKIMFDLTGKKALVTGSTQGIGFAIAKCLSEHGAEVFVNGAFSEDKVKNAAEKIEKAAPVCVDLSKKDCAEKMHEITGDVDILVLNASVQVRKTWDEITDEELNTFVITKHRDTNCYGGSVVTSTTTKNQFIH